MMGSLLRTTFALAIVASLLGLCIADIVHAAMPGDTLMDCGTRLCDGHGGCAPNSAIVVLHGLPWATMPPSSSVDAPASPVATAFVVQSSPPCRPPLRSSGPRSPPLA